MRLRTALNEFKRRRSEPFPGEIPTTTGAFSGYGDRLVYVDRDGSFRDHSAELSGLYGVDRSRFGIETDDEIYWFDDIEPIRQHYYRETSLVETEYDAGEFTIHQYDLTLGRAHLTHVEVRGEVPQSARLVAFLTFAPDGRETQVGRLVHESAGPQGDRAVEVYHREEHDYVAASTSVETAVGQAAESLSELLADEYIENPTHRTVDALEKEALTGDVVVSARLERDGRAARTTLATQVSDHTETTREQALADVTHAARTHASADALRAAALDRVEETVPDGVPRPDAVEEDLRALSLLTAPTGARLAAPEFDHFYEHTGGYGYMWFRDDAEVSLALLEATERLGLSLESRLLDSARLYCRTQREDGSWPHRIWAVDERLAPGWANEQIEGDGIAYQADQTAAVTTFLARLLAERDDLLSSSDRGAIVETVEAAVESLDAWLADNGLPSPCQNAWENMFGQFAHTAGKFLEAYAAVAAAPVGPDVREHARGQATTVLGGLDALWNAEAGLYAMRLHEGERDDRADSAAFALVDGVTAYAEIATVDEETLDRLHGHVETLCDRLAREVDGGTTLIRFEGDEWRSAEQDGEKLWSVAAALGAAGCADLGALLREERDESTARPLFDRAATFYESLLDDGPFVSDAGLLAEQAFDDGRIDGATPLGWSHGVRLATTARLRDLGALPTPTTPAGPEERATWTTGEKYGVGTVADHDTAEPSNVWFTLTEGALTEVRFPRIDTMNLRTLDFLIVDAADDYVGRTHNETRTDDHADTIERTTELLETDALAYRQTVVETGDGHGHEWTLTVDYATDADHDALLVDVEFTAVDGRDYEVYVVADTALTNTGTNDRGFRTGGPGEFALATRDATAFDVHECEPLLFDDDDGRPINVALALTSDGRFEWASVEVAGSERLDGLFAGGVTPEPNEEAAEGSLVLVGRLGDGAAVSDTVALGFAREADTAGALGEAEGALARGFERVRGAYVDSWQSTLSDLRLPDSVAGDDELAAQYRAAVMTIYACQDKRYDGAVVASPSVPWGDAVTADEPKGYGYNFVWSRDLYQTVSALLCIGDVATAHDALAYVYRRQQDEAGFIPQNTYLQGTTRWGGEQMDNISFPAVMAYRLRQHGLAIEDADYDYENVRASADYVVRNGPATAQERWEEEAGYSPSSIAAEIAGLTCAAAIAEANGHTDDALTWYALADEWAARVESLTATETGTDSLTETPYYVRITRDGEPDAGTRRQLANGGPRIDERAVVDAGFLELVRLGIKPPDDETIRNSVSLVDESIRVETPVGPCFYRYVGDGYGELSREDAGAPWHHSPDGKGRLWPIFTGERGEYELLADDGDDPYDLLTTMAGFANEGRMIPEQVWDSDRSTAYNWTFGEGTGSATPLVWSMAQFVRLAHGVDAGEPVETPEVTRRRYEGGRPEGPTLWVDAAYEGDNLVVTVETDGDLVVVRSDQESVTVEPTSGEFVVRIDADYGESTVTVAAATHTTLDTAGTTVEQRRL